LIALLFASVAVVLGVRPAHLQHRAPRLRQQVPPQQQHPAAAAAIDVHDFADDVDVIANPARIENGDRSSSSLAVDLDVGNGCALNNGGCDAKRLPCTWVGAAVVCSPCPAAWANDGDKLCKAARITVSEACAGTTGALPVTDATWTCTSKATGDSSIAAIAAIDQYQDAGTKQVAKANWDFDYAVNDHLLKNDLKDVFNTGQKPVITKSELAVLTMFEAGKSKSDSLHLKGVGKSLFCYCVTQLSAVGIKAVYLVAVPHGGEKNAVADLIGYYEGRGFTSVSSEKKAAMYATVIALRAKC